MKWWQAMPSWIWKGMVHEEFMKGSEQKSEAIVKQKAVSGSIQHLKTRMEPWKLNRVQQMKRAGADTWSVCLRDHVGTDSRDIKAYGYLRWVWAGIFCKPIMLFCVLKAWWRGVVAGCVFSMVASFVCCVLLSFQRYPGVALGMTDGEGRCGHM